MLCSPLSVIRRTVSRQRFGSPDTPLPLRLTLCWLLPSLFFVMNRLPLSCCISLAESSFGAAPCIPSPSSSCPFSSISSRTLLPVLVCSVRVFWPMVVAPSSLQRRCFICVSALLRLKLLSLVCSSFAVSLLWYNMRLYNQASKGGCRSAL